MISWSSALLIWEGREGKGFLWMNKKHLLLKNDFNDGYKKKSIGWINLWIYFSSPIWFKTYNLAEYIIIHDNMMSHELFWVAFCWMPKTGLWFCVASALVSLLFGGTCVICQQASAYEKQGRVTILSQNSKAIDVWKVACHPPSRCVVACDHYFF